MREFTPISADLFQTDLGKIQQDSTCLVSKYIKMREGHLLAIHHPEIRLTTTPPSSKAEGQEVQGQEAQGQAPGLRSSLISKVKYDIFGFLKKGFLKLGFLKIMFLHPGFLYIDFLKIRFLNS